MTDNRSKRSKFKHESVLVKDIYQAEQKEKHRDKERKCDAKKTEAKACQKAEDKSQKDGVSTKQTPEKVAAKPSLEEKTKQILEDTFRLVSESDLLQRAKDEVVSINSIL